MIDKLRLISTRQIFILGYYRLHASINDTCNKIKYEIIKRKRKFKDYSNNNHLPFTSFTE